MNATPSPIRTWPVWVLGAPAAVAIWSGWVGLGQLTGFGKIRPFPGTWLSDWTLDTAITLPIGMEAYAAYALHVWLSGRAPERAQRFARRSAVGALVLGAAGQVAYHLMAAAGVERAPWLITTAVACLPVAVLGMGAALAHLIRATPASAPVPVVTTQTSSPAAGEGTGEAQTADPGDGEPGSNPPQGRRTKPARKPSTGRSGKPTREAAAAVYVDEERAAGRTPTKAGMVSAMRSRSGSGMRDEAAAALFRELYPEGSRSPLRVVLGDASGTRRDPLPEPSREGVKA